MPRASGSRAVLLGLCFALLALAADEFWDRGNSRLSAAGQRGVANVLEPRLREVRARLPR